MFKIVYVVPLLAPYAVPRYQELAKIEGVEVHVIIEQDTSKDRMGWEFHAAEGYHSHLLSSKYTRSFRLKNKKDNYRVDNIRLFTTGLKAKIKEIDPDVVLVCNSTQIMFLVGPRKYKLGIVVEDTLRAAEGRPKFDSFMKRLMLKQADFYLPFSQDAVVFLDYNGINQPFIRSFWSMDTEFFTDLSSANITEKKKELGMTVRSNYIMVANLIPRKGVAQFITAWAKMDEEFQKKSELFVLGEGPLKAELIEYIEKSRLTNIHIEGNKPYKQVSHYLQCGDVFVLPTLEDLCSLAVLEAMASGLPVLTTIYNGARQFVVEGENGYIFDPTNETSIIETLVKISHADLKKMSACSSELIKQYSTEKVMRKMCYDIMQFCGEFEK